MDGMGIFVMRSRNMTPVFSAYNKTSHNIGYILDPTYSCIGESRCSQSADFQNICFNQFGVTIVFPYSRTTPTLMIPITIIVFSSTKPEMRGPDTISAIPVYAIVENTHVLGNGTVMNLPRQAMSQQEFVPIPNMSISVSVLATYPQPTGKQVLNHDDVFPKSFKKWTLGDMTLEIAIGLALDCSMSFVILGSYVCKTSAATFAHVVRDFALTGFAGILSHINASLIGIGQSPAITSSAGFLNALTIIPLLDRRCNLVR